VKFSAAHHLATALPRLSNPVGPRKRARHSGQTRSDANRSLSARDLRGGGYGRTCKCVTDRRVSQSPRSKTVLPTSGAPGRSSLMVSLPPNQPRKTPDYQFPPEGKPRSLACILYKCKFAVVVALCNKRPSMSLNFQPFTTCKPQLGRHSSPLVFNLGIICSVYRCAIGDESAIHCPPSPPSGPGYRNGPFQFFTGCLILPRCKLPGLPDFAAR